jgi:hypothetical protein
MLHSAKLNWDNFMKSLKENKNSIEEKITEECGERAEVSIFKEHFSIRVCGVNISTFLGMVNGVFADITLATYDYSDYGCLEYEEIKKVPLSPEFFEKLLSERFSNYKKII